MLKWCWFSIKKLLDSLSRQWSWKIIKKNTRNTTLMTCKLTCPAARIGFKFMWKSIFAVQKAFSWLENGWSRIGFCLIVIYTILPVFLQTVPNQFFLKIFVGYDIFSAFILLSFCLLTSSCSNHEPNINLFFYFIFIKTELIKSTYHIYQIINLQILQKLFNSAST